MKLRDSIKVVSVSHTPENGIMTQNDLEKMESFS